MPPAPPSLQHEDSKTDLSSSTGTFQGSSYDPASSSVTTTEAKSVHTEAQTVASSGTHATIRTARLKTSDLMSPKVKKRSAAPDFKLVNDSAAKHSIDFESVPLVGRSKEVSSLKACFTRMIATPESGESKKELILIPGKSGAGKSAVAMTLEKEMSQHTDGVFAVGKFDMNASSEPYSGISKAFGDICKKIKESPADKVRAVKAGVEKHLGSDVDLLVHLIPELKNVISDSANDSTVTNIGTDEIESKLERLRFAFRVLMRVLSSVFSPFVIFLDDLQWADVSSLQVLEFLISDTENENGLMVIGCYRSDEVDENSLLHNKIVALQEMSNKYKFHLTTIEIGHFGVNEIEEVISTALPNPNVAATLGLTTICLKRTLGNPFFVLEFLKMLCHEGLLECNNTESKTWSWDVDAIDDATMSTANVVVMLHNQLATLPQQVQALLQCAAYLGSSFTESTIDLVWSTYGRRLVETKIESTSSLLEFILNEQILEKREKSLRWVHDKLQEAALSLTGERRETFQLDIGRTLYYGLDKKQVEDDLFTIVDLINNGNSLHLTEFASANLRAAEKAKDLSAFQSAAEYAAHGLNLLKDDNKWSSTNRELTLKLYTLGAEMEALLKNADASNRYSTEVLSRPDLTVMETLPLKMAKASTIGSTDLKFAESMDFYLELLGELGCKVTWSRRLVPVQAIIKLTKIVKRAKALPQSFYDKLVPIEDPTQKAIAMVFSKLEYYAFIAGDIPMYLLAVCRLVEMTLDHGINEFSAKSFASLACSITISMEDFENGTTFNMIALSMLKKFRGMHASETTFIAYGPGLSWIKPFEALEGPMASAVAEGLKAGHTEYATWNTVSSKLAIPYCMGRPISKILKDCPKAFLQCEDVSQSLNALGVQVFWQMLVNLQQQTPSSTSSSSNSNISPITELEGEIFSAKKDDDKTNVHLAFVHFAQSELILFNSSSMEAAAERALQVKDVFFQLIPAYLLIMVEVFHRAIPLYAMARLSPKPRKYRVEARRLLKKIEKWNKAGNANVPYYLAFLQAEQLALEGSSSRGSGNGNKNNKNNKKKVDMANQKYQDAIQLAKRNANHLHHLGLMHERYADFLLEVCGMETKSKEQLKKAIEYYEEWGAAVKVQSLSSRL